MSCKEQVGEAFSRLHKRRPEARLRLDEDVEDEHPGRSRGYDIHIDLIIDPTCSAERSRQPDAFATRPSPSLCNSLRALRQPVSLKPRLRCRAREKSFDNTSAHIVATWSIIVSLRCAAGCVLSRITLYVKLADSDANPSNSAK